MLHSTIAHPPTSADVIVRTPDHPHRNRQLVRQWRVLQLLGARRWTLRELARELGVHYRTALRDVACLEEAHFPVFTDDCGRYGVLSEWSTSVHGGGAR